MTTVQRPLRGPWHYVECARRAATWPDRRRYAMLALRPWLWLLWLYAGLWPYYVLTTWEVPPGPMTVAQAQTPGAWAYLVNLCMAAAVLCYLKYRDV